MCMFVIVDAGRGEVASSSAMGKAGMGDVGMGEVGMGEVEKGQYNEKEKIDRNY
jgi:hypothetical protein